MKAAAVSVVCRLQLRLVHYYGLEEQPDVRRFVVANEGGRERVLAREHQGELELAVHLPAAALAPEGPASVDALCQLMEGVSHFVLLAERARRELPTTQLELELQAEVDKFMLLCELDRGGRAVREMRRLREVLYRQVRFLFAHASDEGQRYRLANQLADRFTAHLTRRYLSPARLSELRAMLRRFYGVSPTDKVAWARAA